MPGRRADFLLVWRAARVLAEGAALACLGLGSVACTESPHPPDIVLVTLDTFRRDHFGAYAGSAEANGAAAAGTRASASPARTPALDAFAARGLMFDAAFTTIPTTAPAHVSMLTGLHPHQHGVMRNGDQVRDEAVCALGLPRRLAAAGYRTAAFVGSRVLEEPAGLDGFDRYDAPDTYIRPGRKTVRAALEWWNAQSDDAPRFLWVHLFDAHSPYGPWTDPAKQQPHDPGLYGWVDPRRLADPAARAELKRAYARGVEEADAAFGVLTDGLAHHGGVEDGRAAPVVCVVADHGEFLDELLEQTGFAFGHGSALGEPVLSVPLVIDVPAGSGTGTGRRVSSTVSVRDVYTTLARLAGLDDEDATRDGRVDLLEPIPQGRVVTAQRRRFTPQELRSNGTTAAQRRVLDAYAVAVTDGRTLLVVDEEGRETDRTGTAPEAAASLERLLTIARAHLAATRGVSLDEQALTDEQREMLEALGYTR